MTGFDMNFLIDFLGWLLVANLLFVAFRVFIFGSAPKSFVYKVHSHFFKVTHRDFANAHYRGLILHITLLVFFNLLPYLVLRAMI